MRQLILYILFLVSMVFSGYGEVSAASISFTPEKMQAIRKMVWRRLSMTRASLRHSLKTLHSLFTASVAAVRSAYCQVATCTTVRLPVDCLQIESVIYHPFYQL